MLTSLDFNGWPGTGTMPQPGNTGPSWRDSYTGGASAALRYRLTRKQGLQFAPDGSDWRAECRINSGVCGMVGNREAANLGAYRVRRFASRLHEKRSGKKTQCWRRVAVDSPPGLQKSAHKRYAHRSPLSLYASTTFRPCFLRNITEIAPRTVCCCQPVASISCRLVAPCGRRCAAAGFALGRV